MPILIIGDNGSGTSIVWASHDDQSFPEAVDVNDILDKYPNAQKILFVKTVPSTPVTDPENPQPPPEIEDPEPTWTAAEQLFHKLKRRMRKIYKAQLALLETGQSGSIEFQKEAAGAGEELVARVVYDFPMPMDETTLAISGTQQQNCSGSVVTREHDNGFEVTTTSDSAGTVGIRFDWSVTFD